MKLFIYCFGAWLAIFTCNRNMSSKPSTAIADIPDCIHQKIDSIKKLPVGNPPTEIHEYNYAEKKVYVISARCCDFFTIAVDSNCSYVCAPSGGVTGKGDRKCSDFAEKAKLIRLVWKDERERK